MPNKFLWVLVVLLSPLLALAQIDPGQKNFDTGKKYYESGQYSLAIQQFKEALSASPVAEFVADARFMLAESYLKQKNAVEAKSEFERVIQEFPAYSKGDEVWNLLAETVLLQNRPINAAEVLSQISDKFPLSPLAPGSLLRAAGLFAKSDKQEEAKTELIKLINEYPNSDDNVAGQLMLGDLLIAEHQEEAARLRFSSVLIHPKATPDQKNLASLRTADIYLIQKDPQRASEVLKSLSISENSIHYSLWQVINGKILVQTSEWEKGIPLLELGCTQGKLTAQERANAALFLARTYSRINLFDKSRSWYIQLLSLTTQPSDQVTILSEGSVVFLNMGNYDKAWEWSQQVLTQYPGFVTPNSLVSAARIAVQGKKFREAQTIYDQFISRYPTHPEIDRVIFDAAENTWKNLELKSTAAEYFKTIANRKPAGLLADDAVFNLGILYLEMGYSSDANQLWKTFPADFPGSEFGSDIQNVYDTLSISLVNSTALALELISIIDDVNLNSSKGNLAFSLGKLVFKTGIRREIALNQLKVAAESTDLPPESREECYFMLAKLAFQTKDFATSLRYITAYNKEFPAGKWAPELRSYHARFLLLQAKTTDLKTVDGIIASIPEKETAFQLKIELERKRYDTDNRETAIQNLKSLLLSAPNRPLSDQAKSVLAGIFTKQGDTLSAVKYWKELSESDQPVLIESSLRNLISYTEKRNNPVELFTYLDLYLKRFSYSRYAEKTRLSWLKVALISGMTTTAGQWSTEYTRFDRLFEDDAELYESAYYTKAKTLQVTLPDQAMQAFRDYITRFPDGFFLAEAYSSLALLAKDNGDLEMAASYYKQANVFSFGKSGTSLEIANLYFSNGDFKKAISEYNTLMQTAGANDLLFIETRIIASYYRLTNGVLAERMVKTVEKRNPPVDLMAEIAVEKADFLIGQQKYREAISVLDRMMDDYKASIWVPRALFKKAKALELDSKSDEAVPIYQAIMKNYPTSEIISDIYLSLGNYYFRKEAYDQAITNYKIIAERYKTPVDRYQSALNNLIIAYEKYGFYDRALEDLRIYIDRFPNDPEILDKKIKVGILLQKTKNYQQSVTYLSQILQGTSGGLQAEITYNLGEAFFAKGDFPKAIETFESVEKIKNANEKLDWITSSLYMTGQSYEKMGDPKSAIGIYEKISKRPGVDPVFKKAAQKEINRLKSK
ncbi:MAG: tetratricopeptide repeat protein [Bacteroidetes bacterium]|nr:tetratricopeptide repeat protein [Bacteroidota bacterium]